MAAKRAIVIGIGVIALALAMVVRVHATYRTLDMHEIRELLETDISSEAGIDLPYSSDQPKETEKQSRVTS